MFTCMGCSWPSDCLASAGAVCGVDTEGEAAGTAVTPPVALCGVGRACGCASAATVVTAAVDGSGALVGGVSGGAEALVGGADALSRGDDTLARGAGALAGGMSSTGEVSAGVDEAGGEAKGVLAAGAAAKNTAKKSCQELYYRSCRHPRRSVVSDRKVFKSTTIAKRKNKQCSKQERRQDRTLSI